jgi:HNH endonuclease.
MSIPLLIICLALAIVILASFSLPLLRRKRRRARGASSRGRSLFFGRRRAKKKPAHPRSPEWGRVAREHLLREPVCVVCGYKGRKLQVHHIKPFHLHPQLELDSHNLVTLCEARGRNHHLLIGHLDAWTSYNEHVKDDAKHFHHKSEREIRADLHWQKKVLQRP